LSKEFSINFFNALRIWLSSKSQLLKK